MFFNSKDPQCEFLTYETIQTYRGHKPDRTIVIKEKHDMVESEAQKSPCARRFLRSSTTSSAGTPNMRSSNEHLNEELEVVKEVSSKLPNNKHETNGIDTTDNTKKKLNGIEKHTESMSATRNRVTIRKTSITPPVSSTNTPQLVRRSQSLSAKRTTISTFTEFEKSCLKAHNEFRIKHAVSPLKLNKRLCRFSEEWAKVINHNFLKNDENKMFAFRFLDSCIPWNTSPS